MVNQTGWLGARAEREAWEDARECDELSIICSSANDAQRHYYEFSERVSHIRARKAMYVGRPFTWDMERKLFATGRLPYELIPTHSQDTGNCVAAGLAGTGMKLQVLEIALAGQEEKFREWYVPWIYAVSRNQIGGGLRGGGSLGVWGARAVNEYGVLFCDDEGVPKYSGYSDKWGSSRNVRSPEYQKFFQVAEDNKVETVRATSVDEMVELMDAGYLLTIASAQGFEKSDGSAYVVEHKGLAVYRPRGSWMHQMHITDMRREPELMFYRMNQWGPKFPGYFEMQDETPGGAWNLASDLEDELRSGDAEVYGYCNFQGEPGDPDFNFV